MRVPGEFYVNNALKNLLFEELEQYAVQNRGHFLPAIRQIANVATLPGIVGKSIAYPTSIPGTGLPLVTLRRLTLRTRKRSSLLAGWGLTSTAACDCSVRISLRPTWRPFKNYYARRYLITFPLG